MAASRDLHRPRLPFLPLAGVDLNMVLERIMRLDHPLSNIGGGFKVIHTLHVTSDGESIYRESLSMALHLVGLYTLAVDDYLAARVEAQNLAMLGEQRNYVHHSLLRLTPSFEEDVAHIHHVLDLCQMAALIYSFLCVFPIPSAPFGRLARRIKTCLSSGRFSREWTQAPRLLMWIVTMATIASVGHPERMWFIAILDRCRREIRLQSVTSFTEVLQEFLWLPSTNDTDAEDLWEELESLNPFGIES